MKFLFNTATLILAASFHFSANAASISSGKLDMSGRYVILDVVTSGGCGAHYFELDTSEGCKETAAVQCTFRLVERSNDFCEAIISGPAVIDLADSGIYGDSYYSNASITIEGDTDLDNNPTSFTFQMPEMKDFDASIGICTADVNEWGNSSACSCNDERAMKYNQETGLCQL